MLPDPADSPLQSELVKSLEKYNRNQRLSLHKGHIKLLSGQEVELVNWLMSPRETRLQFENLASLLNIPRTNVHRNLLRLLIFNILWSLPESPLSRQLHALYSPAVRQNLSYLSH